MKRLAELIHGPYEWTIVFLGLVAVSLYLAFIGLYLAAR